MRHESEQTPIPPAARMAAYRKRMKAAGYKQVSRWVLDTENPKVNAQIRREYMSLLNHPDSPEDQAWVDAAAEQLLQTLPSYEW